MSALATLTIIVGALLIAGGLQELIVQGILNNLAFPLLGGTLGTVAGFFVLATGIALFRGSADTRRLAVISAAVSLPTFVLIGLIERLSGWPVTILGLGLPIVLVLLTRPTRRSLPLSGQ
jgi:type IV secretory pathway VirB2 component (pilin)